MLKLLNTAILVSFLVFNITSCQNKSETGYNDKGASAVAETEQQFTLTSPIFLDKSEIPERYTCDGEDVSPPLQWSEPPAGTQSFALICDDPDAPRGDWVHWVIYDIPGNERSLEEAIPELDQFENGMSQGRNDFKRIGYGGPCPPPGKPHRYYFKLYALDEMTGLEPGATKAQLLKTIKGHVLAETHLMGKYQR